MAKINLSIDKKSWSQKAQTGELEFHKKPNCRTDAASFYEANAKMFNGFGYKPDSFEGGTVIDVGAGSRLRANYFINSKKYALEPLGQKYIDEVEWCDLLDADEVLSVPIEEKIYKLEEQADFVFSINVLDHCYEFVKSIENIYSYLKPNAVSFITFDCHEKTDDLHPIVVNEKIATSILYDTGFIIGRFSRVAPYHRGIAKYALAYWLRKPNQ